jgi:hypothetical protein
MNASLEYACENLRRCLHASQALKEIGYMWDSQVEAMRCYLVTGAWIRISQATYGIVWC